MATDTGRGAAICVAGQKTGGWIMKKKSYNKIVK